MLDVAPLPDHHVYSYSRLRRLWPWRGPLLWLIYLLLAVSLTWPTITHVTTHLPGDGGDDPAIAWNLWWVKYALLNQGGNPFQTDFMFYPIGINLAFYTLTLLNAVTALPLTLNLGVVTASNLHMFFTFVISGYGAFLLARYILATLATQPVSQAHSPTLAGRRSPVAGHSVMWASAAIAGGFYAFASNKLFYVALGQFNIASAHWVPLAVLYILRTRYQPHRLKNPLLAGLFFTLQAWTEMTYASFLLVFMGLYWGFWILDFGFWITNNSEWRTQRASVANSKRTEGDHRWRKDSPFRAKGPLWAFHVSHFIHRLLAPHLQAILVLTFVCLLGLSPILAQMLPDLLAEGDFLIEGSGFAEPFSADGLGFIIPTIHHPLLGELVRQTGIKDFELGQHIYLGLVLLGLALVALLTGYRYPEVRFWLAAAVIFALLCLGPVITLNGQSTGLSGPFTLIQTLPFFKGNRYPSRYSVMLILSLSVIAAFGLVQLGRIGARRAGLRIEEREGQIEDRRWFYMGRRFAPLLLGLIALIFLFEHLALPLPQSDLRVPAAYQQIAATAGDFAVLDIPFAWRNGFRVTGAHTVQFMFGQFYQTAHQKRLLQGNTSRNPEFKFQYFTSAPIINSLLALETGKTLPPERWVTDRAIAAEVLDFFEINYIVVRPDETGNPRVTPQATLPYIEEVLPVDKIHDEAMIKIYRVRETVAQQNRNEATSNQVSNLKSGLLIDTRSPLASLYFGEGWGLLTPGQPVAAQRREARLLLPLTGGPQRVTVRLRQPDIASGALQTLTLVLNGWRSQPQAVQQEWQELSFDLPATVAHLGLNDLRLQFAGVSPLALPEPTITPPVELTILSAGEEVGNFGHIFVNGHEVSPNQRGYNIAILQPDTNLLTTANFDTHLDAAASPALARFIAAAPPDALIAIAAADEVSLNLSEAAVQALQATGAASDLRGCFRCSHAFIRTGSGTTFEALDPLRPVGLTTGLGLTEPEIAALIDSIRVEAVEQ